ncbi:MAG: M18 family aminopeptidase [Desulfamplus sp.]|nr:M18 family aminopeptidase [Desulfamplus sp.]
MNQEKYNESLFNFIKHSPTQYHAVANMVKTLSNNGFIPLKEDEKWIIKPYSKYFVTRNGSSIIAFLTGDNCPWESGIKLVGAHTDSPCLKVKPIPEVKNNGMVSIGVEIYGGLILNSWLDRGLNLAGRVTVLSLNDDGKESIFTLLVNYDSALATIPSLAIHLDRDVNTKKVLNPQVDMLPLLDTIRNTNGSTAKMKFREILLEQVIKQHSNINIKELLDFDLSFSDSQPPFFTGANQTMISSPRLDNLLSCHAALKSIVRSTNGSIDKKFSTNSNPNDVAAANSFAPCMIVCTDHEEVGSDTASGARGSFLSSVLSRLIPNTEDRIRSYAKSFIISLDNAHALHPSYNERHDLNHAPLINNGPVLKINGSQRYASDCESSAMFRYICRCADIPMQTFVMRSDMPCGSTIGPAISSSTGIKTVDVGAPTLGMHSIREITGSDDPFMLFKAVNQFFSMDLPPIL